MNMKRFILACSVLLTALVMQAQDEVLHKYTEMGDVNTTYVSKGMLEQVPIDQFNIPGLDGIISKIENLTLLVSRGDKAGKDMGKKLPRQLERKGFKTQVDTKRDDTNIRILQKETDPTRLVIVFYEKPHATVVSLKMQEGFGISSLFEQFVGVGE